MVTPCRRGPLGQRFQAQPSVFLPVEHLHGVEAGEDPPCFFFVPTGLVGDGRHIVFRVGRAARDLLVQRLVARGERGIRLHTRRLDEGARLGEVRGHAGRLAQDPVGVTEFGVEPVRPVGKPGPATDDGIKPLQAFFRVEHLAQTLCPAPQAVSVMTAEHHGSRRNLLLTGEQSPPQAQRA
ncbi:hypothetical protein [Streptomyces tibetensis]|uniref:hypothetical protein n=1 Tax=Streptomyces tibetensis TaxID=2382123 RepID=UPI0033D88BBB